MKKFISSCLVILLLFLNPKLVVADNVNSELPECIVITHCVREDWQVNDLEASFTKAVEIVSNTARTKIVERKKNYIHAEAKTKWRRYTDDLLLKALPDKNIIQVRSESRVGIGDNGVNKKRVDNLAYRLMTNQIN